VTDVVGKKNFDLSSLWGSTRSDYLPCEDSGLLHSSSSNGMSGYQQDSLLDKSSSDYQTNSFQGYNASQQQQPNRKSSDDWTSGWEDSEWVDSPVRPANSEKSKSSKTAAKSKAKKKESGGLLIDFGDEKTSAVAKDEKWDNDWEDEAWESLNKDD